MGKKIPKVTKKINFTCDDNSCDHKPLAKQNEELQNLLKY